MATTPKVQWLWDIRYVDAPVLRWRDADNDENHTLEETLYFCNDANMNVTALVNASSGDVVERYVYDPYGKVTITDANWSVITWANSKKNEILYCGYRWDPETGLYHVRHRYYHPTLGRWTTRDPKVYSDTYNLYQYCVSAPLRGVDPLGASLIYGDLHAPRYEPPAPDNTPTHMPMPEKYPTDPPPQQPKPAQRTGLLDSILGEAELRRGRGPWRDSAQHCWAACYIAARYSVSAGQLAAAVESYTEWRHPAGDWQRDIAAQHFGAMCPIASPVAYFLFPSKMCDCCCSTSAKP